MKEFIAKNAKQLNLCLRMLYAENVSFAVTVKETDKRKIIYGVSVQVDDETFQQLKEKYRILIS